MRRRAVADRLAALVASRPASLLASLTLTAWATLGPGCAGADRERGRDAEDARPARAVRPPVLEAPRSALEARLYVIESEDHAVERSLEALRRSGDAWDAPEFDRWRDNGVRVLNASASAVDRLDPVWASRGVTQRTQLGEVTRWSPSHTGPMFDATSVGTDTGVLDLDPGRLEVMARSWTVSRRSWDDDRPGVRVELVPRYRARSRDRFGSFLSESESARDELWFDRLRAELVTGGDRAFVFLAASPLADWSGLDPAPVGALPVRRSVMPPIPEIDGADAPPGDEAGGAGDAAEDADPDVALTDAGPDLDAGVDADADAHDGAGDAVREDPMPDIQPETGADVSDPFPSPVRRLTLGSLLLPSGPATPMGFGRGTGPAASDADGSTPEPGRSRTLLLLVVRPTLGSGGAPGSGGASGR